MALTTLSNLWTPDVWVRGLRERAVTRPSIFSSGIATRTPLLDERASGEGSSVNIPFFKSIADQDDEIQVENTAPVTTNGITTGKMVAAPLNRQTKSGATALSAQVSGADPVSEILDQLADRRLKQRQKTLTAILRGLFASDGARNAAACLSACRLGGVTDEPFDESGADATSDQLFNPDMFIDAKTLFGELADELSNGVLLMHSTIKARLEKLDKDGFKTGKPSDLPFTINTYRDIPLIVSDTLVRSGTGSGYVYDTYMIAKGTVGLGEKAQAGDIMDVASLQLFLDRDLNNEFIWDRTRHIMHVNGTKWVGTAAGSSATNVELQAAANWNLVYAEAKLCGAVCIRTNG